TTTTVTTTVTTITAATTTATTTAVTTTTTATTAATTTAVTTTTTTATTTARASRFSSNYANCYGGNNNKAGDFSVALKSAAASSRQFLPATAWFEGGEGGAKLIWLEPKLSVEIVSKCFLFHSGQAITRRQNIPSNRSLLNKNVTIQDHSTGVKDGLRDSKIVKSGLSRSRFGAPGFECH
ncbi:hypothetical protein PoB_003402500, partial [Plakobranchus ocellatus]